ncbi:MAG: hypothetical protein HYX92_08695 [Chloroflexi bacterium]|nr:hypothetical protein [Chloroflexota bacterium]
MPTATICHQPFELAARRQAAALGYPGLPIVLVPQPQPSDGRAAFQKRAEEALPDILKAVTKPAPEAAK